MRLDGYSIMVDDQAKALKFYTETLGFQVRHNIPMGEHSWITVVSPEDPDGTELGLEPDAHPAAKVFMAAMVEDGIPYTQFGVDDVKEEHARLESLGVRFTQPPVDYGTVIVAVFDDTCGNLIQIAQQKEAS
jgi:catechol 2,3-dioxygenase-like lactoylglutathione lyase family enzyme